MQAGQTLYSLAREYGVSEQVILEYNPEAADGLPSLAQEFAFIWRYSLHLQSRWFIFTVTQKNGASFGRCAAGCYASMSAREARYRERAVAWAWAVRSNSSVKKNGSDRAAEL